MIHSIKLTIGLEKSFSNFPLLHNATDSLNKGNSISPNIDLPGVSSVNLFIFICIGSKFYTCLGTVKRSLRNTFHTNPGILWPHWSFVSQPLSQSSRVKRKKKKVLRIRISMSCSESRGLITVSSSVAAFVYDSFFASIIGTWWYACHFYRKQQETLKTIYIKLQFFRW